MHDNNDGERPVDTAWSFFDRPVEPRLVPPSPVEVDRVRRAFVQRRILEIQARHQRRIARRLRTLGRRDADVQALRARLAVHQRSLLVAETEDRAVRAIPPPPRGLAHDAYHRASSLGLVVALTICVVADYLVDRGALQVLLLPLRLTQVLALLVAVVQTLAAHTVGRLLRRLSLTLDPDVLAHERTIMRLLAGLVVVTVVGLAALRAVFGTALLGLLMLGTGAAAALVAVTASYLHASLRVDALGATERRIRRRAWLAIRTGRRLLGAVARRTAAVGDLRASASAVAVSVDLVYDDALVHLDGDEPPWIQQMRRWAEGDELPYDEAS